MLIPPEKANHQRVGGTESAPVADPTAGRESEQSGARQAAGLDTADNGGAAGRNGNPQHQATFGQGRHRTTQAHRLRIPTAREPAASDGVAESSPSGNRAHGCSFRKGGAV